MNIEDMTPEQMREALKKMTAPVDLKLKVSEKGAVSVYGLQRFPVTLYAEQWTRILDAADQLRQFIETNRSFLRSKE